MSRPYAEVIGDPIAHSKSPLIHRFWLEKLGIAADYRAIRVRPANLRAYLSKRRHDPDWRGCNVTMPLKECILPLLDTVSRSAKSIGAVNTVRCDADGCLHGYNTDVHGVWRSTDALAKAGSDILVIGAGGAARAAAYALSRSGRCRISVMNRDRTRAAALKADFRLTGALLPLGPIPQVDLVVNASALGTSDAPWPELDISALSPDAVVFDMVYNPPCTELLRSCFERQLQTIDGLTMLIWQAEEAFAIFFRHAAPSVRDHLRALLAR